MSDPVAEAAAQLAQLANEQKGGDAEPPSMIQALVAEFHGLEAKVEHLIHPDAVQTEVSAPVATAIVSTLDTLKAGAGSTMPGESMTNAQTAATTQDSATAGSTGADLPNAASAAGEPTAELASAPNAGGADITASNVANSGEDPNVGGTTAAATVDSAEKNTPTSNPASLQTGPQGSSLTASPLSGATAEPLHMRIAHHLEAIYTLAREHVEAPVAADTSALKTHVGDILHRISNGMAVTEGELVSKLEALYRML